MHQALDRFVAATTVGDQELTVAPDCILHHGQHREILGRATPARRVHEQPFADRGGPLAQPIRQRRHQLAERPFGRARERALADDARLCHEERTKLDFIEAGYFSAPPFVELPAAARPAQGKDGHPGCAERFHVAVQRARRDLEARRKAAPGHAAVRLEQQKNREQAVGFHERLAVVLVRDFMVRRQL
jgi:hypothetical protein